MNITKSDIAKVALLTTKIENMELSTRAYTALKRWGCDTLLDVADLYPNEIRKVRFLGEKTIAEITRKLAVMGIHFDDSGDCTGCRWKDRPQKCSCCRRNQNLKDCYEEAGGAQGGLLTMWTGKPLGAQEQRKKRCEESLERHDFGEKEGAKP